MANNISDSGEIGVVETEQDLPKELGFDIAAAVFEPDDRTIEINLNKQYYSASSSNSGNFATDSGKPVNTHVEFVSDGVAVHHVKTDPSMQIPGNDLDDKKKAQIKAKAEKSKAVNEKQEKEESERA